LTAEREQLWSQLIQGKEQHVDRPQAIMGNFNTARFFDEKIRGKSLTFEKLSLFNDCLTFACYQI